MPLEDDIHGPSVKFHPALVFLACTIAAYGGHRLWPIRIEILLGYEDVGTAVMVVGVCIVILAQLPLRLAKTNIDPRKPTTKIVSTGLYAYSRNPIYMALCLISTGIGIRANSLIMILSVIPLAVLLYWAAIRKEEAYLERKFSDEYLRYKNKVRRWL